MNAEQEPQTSQFGATVVAPNSLPSRVSSAHVEVEPLGAGPAAWIGREIDDYRILRVLGAGGMGVVFLAQQRNPKRLVAIKTLHAGLHQADLLARFQQEAEILAPRRVESSFSAGYAMPQFNMPMDASASSGFSLEG